MISDEDEIDPNEYDSYGEALDALMKELKAMTDYTDANKYRKKLLALGDFYVKRYTFNWFSLYQGERCRRISLPTYPFERKRYWITQNTGETKKKNEPEKTINCLHALAHENKSTFNEQRFVCSFNGKEFFFEDHKVNGKKLLPGVAYLEMARAAAELAGGQEVTGIRNIIWAQPIALTDENPVLINTFLFPEDKGAVYAVRSLAENEENGEQKESVLHSQGKVFFQTKDFDSAHKQVDLGEICKRFVRHIEGSAVYEHFVQQGLEYGKTFQTL